MSYFIGKENILCPLALTLLLENLKLNLLLTWSNFSVMSLITGLSINTFANYYAIVAQLQTYPSMLYFVSLGLGLYKHFFPIRIVQQNILEGGMQSWRE